MITKDLLNSLTKLEADLQEYSFDALLATDAVSLKHKFNIFKNDLASRVIGDRVVAENKHPKKEAQAEVSQLPKIHRLSEELLGKVTNLKKSRLDEEQYNAVASIELAASIILELVTVNKID